MLSLLDYFILKCGVVGKNHAETQCGGLHRNSRIILKYNTEEEGAGVNWLSKMSLASVKSCQLLMK